MLSCHALQEGLLQKIEDIALPRDWMWIETLDVHTTEPLQVDENDDLKREAAFYESSLDAVKLALIQLKQSGVPFERPADYYAESVKPDTHMSKIKQILINDKKRMEEVEERRRKRDIRKFAKAVRTEKVNERLDRKRAALEEIDRVKNRNKHNDVSSAEFKASLRGGGANGNASKGKRFEDSLPGGVEAAERKGKVGYRGKRDDGAAAGGKSHKRAAKDEKYGAKKTNRRNTPESFNDTSSYSRKHNESAIGQFGPKGSHGKRGGAGGNKRK